MVQCQVSHNAILAHSKGFDKNKKSHITYDKSNWMSRSLSYLLHIQ